MQVLIRQQSAEDFPAVEKFRELKDDGALGPVELPAKAILRLAFDESLAYEDPRFDVRDEIWGDSLD